MAYVKMKPFHTNKGKTIAETLKKRTEYAQNPDKTSLKNIIEYAENHDKTENGEFVLTYECDTQTADTDFLAAKKEYHRNTGRKQKSDVLGYSIIQSFKPGEVTPQRAAAIGYELAMRWTKGNHAFVVGTHLDKSHLHCHVVFNSVNLDCSKKFRNFWGSVGAIRRLSNIISIENGLSIIKPSRNKTKNFDKWTSGVKMPTDRQQLEKIIDEVFTENPKSFNEFITLLENKNCEFKRSRNSVRLPKKKGFLRLDSLTDGYKQDDIQRKIEGDFKGETMSFQPNISRENNSQDFNLIIDLENSIKAQNSPGYEHWTKIFNLKQAAKTLVFLQENDLDEMEKLDVAAQKSKDDYNEIVTKIQAADLR
ncbi:MAG: relaxase/mobilization nuclease domain-containing protein, partial [Oscillospiraceae bacterium]|nr:relaxase/mobilization nuclease domain-containing protein [Oscillospiraceae bacterium]